MVVTIGRNLWELSIGKMGSHSCIPTYINATYLISYSFIAFIFNHVLKMPYGSKNFFFFFSATDSSMVGAEGHNSTFEGDVTSPPTTAGGAGDNTLSPVLSPTSDTEHTTAGTLFLTLLIFPWLTVAY